MPHTLSFGDLSIEGSSRAGEETWFRVHPPGLALDVGRGSPRLMGVEQIFLTHGHLDHALGIPYLLSLRSVKDLESRIYCPAPLASDLCRLIEAAQQMEAQEFRYSISGIEPGDKVRVGKSLTIEAFATDHVVPSLGYHLWRRKKHLAVEYRELPPASLRELKDRGTVIDRQEDEIWLSYCGDTGRGVFELEPRVFESRVLLLECTFFDGDTRSRAESFKHIHLEDLVCDAARFRNVEMVLHHSSRRHRRDEILNLITRRLADISPRIHLFGV